MEWIYQPFPWYISGTLIGLIVPTLLILGNKTFGISSSLRHVCAACMPANIQFFKYDWKKEMWNLFFVFGIFLGAFLTNLLIPNTQPVDLHPNLIAELKSYQITDFSNLVPIQLFTWENLFTLKGFMFFVIGGFLVGFGTRYAGGCTSGHAIMGLSSFQFPSLIATISFMIGGFIGANFLIPFLLQ